MLCSFKLLFTRVSAPWLEHVSHPVILQAMFEVYVVELNWKINTSVPDKWSSFVFRVYSGYLVFIHLCQSPAVYACVCVCVSAHLYACFFLVHLPFVSLVKLYWVKYSLRCLFVSWEVTGAREQIHPCHETGRDRKIAIRTIRTFVYLCSLKLILDSNVRLQNSIFVSVHKTVKVKTGFREKTSHSNALKDVAKTCGGRGLACRPPPFYSARTLQEVLSGPAPVLQRGTVQPYI